MGSSEELILMYNVEIERLEKLWDQFGLDYESRTSRRLAVKVHVEELLEQMVKEEEELKERIEQNIGDLVEQLETLSKELGMEPPCEDTAGPLLAVEQHLKEMVAERIKIKETRLKKFGELLRQELILCDKLGESPTSVSNSIPSVRDMQTVSQHIDHLAEEMERRKKEFLCRKDSILKLMKELDRTPITALEVEAVTSSVESVLLHQDKMRDLQCLEEKLKQNLEENKKLITDLKEQLSVLQKRLEMDTNEPDIFMSTVEGCSHSAIAKIQKEIQRCEELKRENLGAVLQRTYAELKVLWEQCLVGEAQQKMFDPATDISEEKLEELENEVKRLKNYFNECRDIFTLYESRGKLWQKMKRLEELANDPERLFKNRGGNLLAEEKMRKKIHKDLPEIEETLKEMITDWESKTGNTFLVWGQSLTERLDQQWTEYLNEKEQQKLKRHAARERQLKEESALGSRPAVPLKRRLALSPAVSKVRRMSPGNRAKLGASRFLSPFKRQGYKKANRSGHKLGKTPNSASIPRLVVTSANKSLLSVDVSYTNFEGAAASNFLSSSQGSEECSSSYDNCTIMVQLA